MLVILKNIQKTFLNKGGTRKIIVNTGWLFFDRVFRMGIGIIVSLWIARYLGPNLYGILNYSLSFIAIFAIGGSLGLDGIVIRDLVNDKDKDKTLGSAFILKLIGGVLSLALSFIVIKLSQPEDPILVSLVLISSLSFIFQSFDVIDFYFQSNVQSKYSVIAKNVAFLISAGLKVAFILNKNGLLSFAFAYSIEFLLASFFLIINFQLKNGSVFNWILEKRKMINLLGDSWSLALSAIVVVIYMKIDQIMLGEMIDNTSVGIYSAAVKISEIWYFIPMVICSSIFPNILNSKKNDLSKYHFNLKRLYSLMSIISMAIAVVFSFIGTKLIVLLYGEEFQKAGKVLSVHIWAGVFVFLGVASSQFLMAENYNRVSFYRTLIGAILNVLLNLVLIPAYQELGAAIATLLSYFVATFSQAFFKPTREQTLIMLKTINPLYSIKILLKLHE
jgi:polysaccharide transporter, PST family